MAPAHDPLRRALLDTLDLLPVGIVVLSGRRVIAANREATRIGDGDGLRLRRGMLSFGSRAANEAFARAVDRARGPVAFRVPRLASERGYECLVLRLAAGDASVLFIADPDPLSLDGDALRQLHGLTNGEVRVVNRLTSGAPLQAVAEELCLSAHTVRAHLRSVFAKTGTRGQADLMRILLCGVARMRCREIPQTSDAE